MHVFPVRVYYEDTDHSGVVYHANYLKYCERAREHVLDPDDLVRLYNDEGIGFVVYKAEMTFKEGAVFGDELEVRTTVKAESDYRLIFRQDVWRKGGRSPLVENTIHLVCVNRDRQLVPLPPTVVTKLRGA